MSEPARRKVIIIGGGVGGGLALALMLNRRGLACEICEQAGGSAELGVGMNLLPQAVGELAGLGLLRELDAVAIRTHELIYLSRRGQEVWRELRGLEAGNEVPQFSIHRGHLHGCCATPSSGNWARMQFDTAIDWRPSGRAASSFMPTWSIARANASVQSPGT